MLAKVPQRHTIGKVVTEVLARGLREQDLPTVSSGHDAVRTVNIQAQVSSADERGLPRMQPNAHPHRRAFRPCMHRQRPKGFYRSGDGIGGRRKCNEERISLRVELMSSPILKHRAHDTPLVGKDLSIPVVTKVLEEVSGSLDVCEEERNLPCRQ